MTDQWIAAWRNAAHTTTSAQRAEQKALDEAIEHAQMPERLRPATEADIYVGAVLWYPDGDSGAFWAFVEEVLRPSDPFKAFSAQDGCRYGLDGAFVEDTPHD